MTSGKKITIHIEHGEASAIRHVELANWTGQALLCPRNRVTQLAERWRHVLGRPGVYFLFSSDQTATRDVYIGEAEDVIDRLKRHVLDPEWHEALAFTSKDEHLTKAHAKYLESRLISRAKEVGRYGVRNGKGSSVAALPRADQESMEDFLQQMPLLLGVMGHRVLDPLTSTPRSAEAPLRFVYAVKNARAVGTVTDEGFVVFRGSTALKGTVPSLTPGYIAMKTELEANGKLVEAGELLRFANDVLFKSPSAAAGVVYGNNVNGREAWRTEDGRSLKSVEEEWAE